MQQHAKCRISKQLEWLGPDAKSQITILYDVNQMPCGIDNIVLSTQHLPDIKMHDLKEAVIEEIIKPVIPEQWLQQSPKFFINPAGPFVIGGPVGDCGLTGRKIIVDTYGGFARHGGGCFSGKDPSKVDRSAAYMARYVAKNLVAAALADRCEIQITYAIGVCKPTSIRVDTFGTAKLPEAKIASIIDKVFDLTPYGIITTLDLKRPIYRQTASLGHFGREGFPWENLDKVAEIKSLAAL